MYEFIVNGIIVTREEFFQDVDNRSIFGDFIYERIAEAFRTGSVTVGDYTLEIKEVSV